ncbi:hypothetical protein PVAND_003328 [Polypedilum vanderplanki]|uniref:CYTH domain-containing protein n=1 Tax=Polypedilum vanderplanki TaxID=319348 RepID=A0A9J6BUS6_POLVA|nr:hypothetical protein PVAND_003328 [Polypedilum vanderplanki]
MSRDNCRNIEIKAKLSDENEFNEKVKIAANLIGNKETEILKQHDVFFKVPQGRLKLRYEEGKTPKLIQYARDNITGPKLSKFDILEVKDGELFEKMMNASIGTLGILDKTRHLFMYERTRIHLDKVKNGNNAVYYGLEFEVMLNPDENIETGNKVAEELMEKFKLKKEQLMEGSYFEILNS